MFGHEEQRARAGGFTLIELLITVVVVGVLTAIVIVGFSGLVDSGQSAACQASMDAAKAATTAYHSQTGNSYPQAFSDLTSPPAPLLEPAANVKQTATALSGRGWTINMTPGPTTTDQPTFSGC